MKRLFFLFLSMALVINLFSVSTGDQDKNEKKVSLKKNEKGLDETYLFFEGIVSAAQELKLKTSSKGVVAEVRAAPGDRVKSGQLLMILKIVGSEKEIKKAEDYVKIWEKTLYNRQYWRVRSGAAERQAERKIKEAKELLVGIRNKYAGTKIYSLISGKVGFIVEKDKLVEEDSVVAVIIDDSSLETAFSSGSEIIIKYINQFKTGQEIPITFKEVGGVFSGNVKKVGKKITIFIPNPDFVLSPGMRARFRLKKTDLQTVSAPDAVPEDKKSIPESAPKKDLPEKQPTEKILSAKKEYKGKRFEYEFSLGLTYSFSEELYYRESAIDNLIEQYTQNYGIAYTASGKFSKRVMFFPVQALVNYHLKKNIYLKAGVEYGFSNSSPENSYQVMWDGFSEEHKYSLSNKITYIMPFFGGEIRFSSFGIYANLGLNFLSFSHQQNLDYSDASYWSKREDSIKANGTGFGILLGGKYKIKLKKKINLLVKIEFFYLSVGSLRGTRESNSSDSEGAVFSESINGNIYSYEMNPYNREWFYHWDLYASAPTEPWYRYVGKMTLNLYSIRLLFGIVF